MKMTKKHFTYKNIFIGLFMLIISTPTILTMWESIGGKRLDVTLADNSGTTYEHPNFEIQAFIDGQFQYELENYWNNNFVLHGVFTKTYNQLRFSTFQLNHSAKDGNYEGIDLIVGKNKNIFEALYIIEYNQSSENTEQINDYVKDLEDVSNKLNTIEKKLIVMTTPTKCDYMNDDVPAKFVQNEGKRRAIDDFRELIEKTHIEYIDTKNVIDEKCIEYPIFYHSGIHWSRPAEQYASVEVLNMIEYNLGVPLKSVTLNNIQSSDTPYWRDADLWNLLNVWEEPNETYYQFEETLTIPEGYEDFNILIQGGSFASGFRKMLLENHVSPLIQYINYDNALIDMDENITTVINSDWNRLDWQELLDSSDIIVIEINEAHLSSCSLGFVSYLNNYLDSYIALHH